MPPACRHHPRHCALYGIAARHWQVEAFIQRRKHLCDGNHLQPIILTVEQGVLIFARRVDLVAHRLGRQVHAQQDAKFGLFTNAVRVKLGKITAPGLA